jgi:hypothetical protein
MSTVGNITLVGYVFSESPKYSPKESFGPLESTLDNVHLNFHRVNLIFWGEIELSEQFPKSKQEEFNISYAS